MPFWMPGMLRASWRSGYNRPSSLARLPLRCAFTWSLPKMFLVVSFDGAQGEDELAAQSPVRESLVR